MEFKKVLDFVEENKQEYLEKELATNKEKLGKIAEQNTKRNQEGQQMAKGTETHQLGQSFDFWNNKEDDIYDVLYKDDLNTNQNELFIQYRLGYDYNGENITYSNAQTMDFATAQSWLKKEQETDAELGVTTFLVKETIKRERL